MQSWNIDPSTGDYVNNNGQPDQTNSLNVPAYFRLKISRLQWMYAPDSKYGSDYYTLKKRPAINGNQRIENMTVKALQPLVDDGRASSIQADVTENDREGIVLTTQITDATGEVEVQAFDSLGL